jgi:hypothetical protein
MAEAVTAGFRVIGFVTPVPIRRCLVAAGTQVSGWYENMLLGALTRQFKDAACMKASE